MSSSLVPARPRSSTWRHLAAQRGRRCWCRRRSGSLACRQRDHGGAPPTRPDARRGRRRGRGRGLLRRDPSGRSRGEPGRHLLCCAVPCSRARCDHACRSLDLARYVAWRTRSAVARLAADLGEAPPPGSLRSALAAGLRDPTLEVAYPLSGSTRFVDGDGNPVAEPVAGQGRVLADRPRGQPRRRAHARSAVGEDELARDIGAAARLEWKTSGSRLSPSPGFTICALRGHASSTSATPNGGSWSATCTTALSSGYSHSPTSCASRARPPRRRGDGQLAARLDGAVEDAHTALEELRELAHGIYPAILAEAGLASALWNLVDEAPIAVELVELAAERYSHAAEAAAYVMVDDAVADAARRRRLTHSSARDATARTSSSRSRTTV